MLNYLHLLSARFIIITLKFINSSSNYALNWNGWGTLGTWVTGIILAILARGQNKINKRSQDIELALRYQSHYSRFIVFTRKTVVSFLT